VRKAIRREKQIEGMVPAEKVALIEKMNSRWQRVLRGLTSHHPLSR